MSEPKQDEPGATVAPMQPSNERHVIMVGTARGWEQAPVEGEIWAINNTILKRDAKVCFHMHDLELYYNDPQLATKQIIERCARLHIPLVTLRHYEAIAPTSVEYPKDPILRAFGTTYFNSTVDFMVAYALFRNVTRIDIYGINMEMGSEYMGQKASLEFWLGVAAGRGVWVNTYGDNCELLKTADRKIYGYKDDIRHARPDNFFRAGSVSGNTLGTENTPAT